MINENAAAEEGIAEVKPGEMIRNPKPTASAPIRAVALQSFPLAKAPVFFCGERLRIRIN
jgi:hypothetical protein